MMASKRNARRHTSPVFETPRNQYTDLRTHVAPTSIEFSVNRASFLVPHRDFALLLDLTMQLMSPAVAMKRTDWYQIWTTIQGQQEVLNFPSCREYSSLVWLGVAFNRWLTKRYHRVLRRAFQVMELQASTSCTYSYISSFLCTSPLAVTTVVGSWISAESPFCLSSNPFCSACALMLRSQPRILVSLEMLKWAPALP